jgi:glucan-binding YG repeat protein
MKKVFIAMVGAAMLLANPTVTEVAAAKTVQTTGWVQSNGSWYYYSAGVKKTGWVNDAGKWYYLDSTGKVKTGWVQDGNDWYFLSSSGAMQTGWIYEAERKLWYYLEPSGKMKTGWLFDQGEWYYLHPLGYMLTEMKKIDGKFYNFNYKGEMQTGWILFDKSWYYYDESGARLSGWLLDNGKWYYLEQDGRMVRGGTHKVGNDIYFFNYDGTMHTGWKYYFGGINYYKESGALARGWTQIGVDWYYFDGNMLTSQFVDGYYLNNEGKWKQPGSADNDSVAEVLKSQLKAGMTKEEMIQLLGPTYLDVVGFEYEQYTVFHLKVTGPEEYASVEVNHDPYRQPGDTLANEFADIIILASWGPENKTHSIGMYYFDAEQRLHHYHQSKGEYIYQ